VRYLVFLQEREHLLLPRAISIEGGVEGTHAVAATGNQTGRAVDILDSHPEGDFQRIPFVRH
jgi:hypothetical protein